MITKILINLLVVSFIFNCNIIFAQNSLKDTLRLQEIVVTGTKNSVSRNNVPMTVSVINQKQIEESSESALLPVLSEQVPGVFITERGVSGFGVSGGSAGSINIRGIGGNPNTQTLILLNGNPQFAGLMGHPLPDAYIASDVQKVEIIRGPASTLYGSNAMGGVINIITKEQREDGLKLNAHTMAGSFSTQKYMLNGGYRNNGFNVFASYNNDRTNGHRAASDFAINNGYVKVGYNFDDHFNINADFSTAHFTASDPGPENGIVGFAIDITRAMGAVSFDNQFDKSNGSVRFFYNYGEHHITDGFHSTDDNYGLIAYQSFNLFYGNTITFGLDYKQYGGKAENLKAMNGRGMVFGDTTSSEFAGYGYIQQTFFDKLFFNAGFRLEHSNVFGNEAVPSIGIAYHLSNSTTINASVAKGFRSPTIRELYLFTPANRNLEPERMVNYEIGVLQKLFENQLSLELTAFKAEGDNLIQIVFTPKGPQNQNTGTFSNSGIEFAANYRPINNFSFKLNYSYISLAKPIIASPEQQLFISGSYRWNDISLNISVQHIKGLYTQIAPTQITESYTLLNSKVSYVINNFIDVFIKAENLTNKKYYINYAYPMPGTITYLGVNLHY